MNAAGLPRSLRCPGSAGLAALAPPPQPLPFRNSHHTLCRPSRPQQWNPADPWTFFSVADEAGEGGGGTLQLWRVSDLVYRPEEEVLAELEPYR